jgi:DNA polymerase-3 subunit delta'
MAFSADAAFSYLRRAHEQSRLAHAYLISGAPGSGKRELASRLANLANGGRAEDIFATGASQVFVAEPESKSRRIVIDQIRNLEHSLQMRATDGRRKVAIVSDADRLQPQAANAFLKTLEEPPNDSLLLLLSALPEALPDTILSRCVPIPLARNEDEETVPEETELVELLASVVSRQPIGVQESYRLAQGLQRLLAKTREAIQTENAAALKQEEVRYKNTTDGAWLDDREDHFKALTESMYIQRRAHLVEVLYRWWSDVLRARTGIAVQEIPAAAEQTRALSTRLSTPEILKRIRRVEDLRDQLNRNIQEALAIEVAFLGIFRI